MEREQIIKDLECCKFGKNEAKCKECNWHPWTKPRCWRLLASNALSLIKELTEKSKMWQEAYDCIDSACRELSSKCDRLTEENERLRAENEALAISEVKECEISQMLVYRIRNKHPAVMAVIADTVQKYREKLYREFASLGVKDKFNKEFFLTKADQIAKEMLEGE